MNYKTIRKFAIVFAAVCIIDFLICLCGAVTLPTKEVYKTIYGTVVSVTRGSFDIRYASSLVLFAFGAFWGIALWCAIPSGRVKKEKKEKVEPVEQPEPMAVEPPVEEPAAPEAEPEA